MHYIFAGFKEEMLKHQIAVKMDLDNLKADVSYVHYLLNRNSGNASGAGDSEMPRRITEFIPCRSYTELQQLNEELAKDKRFSRHAVRFLPL